MSPLFQRLALLAVLGIADSARAQVAASATSSRAEQAQQFNIAPLTQGVQVQQSGLIPAGMAPPSPGDADLGQQVLLKEREKASPFSSFASLSGFFTNNAALTNVNRVSDYFFVGEVGASYQPRISNDLVAEFTVREATFRYAHYGQLDFESLNAGCGLTYTSHTLGDVAFSARFNFNMLTDGTVHDVFFKNETLTLAAFRSFPIKRAQAFYAGISALFSWSQPVDPGRDEFGITAGYHVNWSRSFSTDLFYRPALFDYPHGRNDWNQTLTLALRWDLTRWLSVTGTLSEDFDNSNDHIYNYQVFNPGVGLIGTITF